MAERDEEQDAARSFAEAVERSAVRGACQSMQADQSDVIRIWALARGFLGRPSDLADWESALRAWPEPPLVPR